MNSEPNYPWKKEAPVVRSSECDVCGGTGKVLTTHWSWDGDSDRQIPDDETVEPCEECGGTGRVSLNEGDAP